MSITDIWRLHRSTILLGVMLSTITLYGFDYAFGQNIAIVEGVEIDMTQMGIIIGIGVAAGFWRAWQGYKKTASDWDSTKFWEGVANSIMASVPIAMTTVLTMPEMTPLAYFWTFFTVIGIVDQYQTARKPTIPSNATESQIAALTGKTNPNGEHGRQTMLAQFDAKIKFYEGEIARSKQELEKWQNTAMPEQFEPYKKIFTDLIRREIRKTQNELDTTLARKQATMSHWTWES